MTYSYDPYLVAWSVVIAVLASYVALDVANRVTVTSGWSRVSWIIGGAVAMGTGIWSMHFTGMLAFQMPVPVAYDGPTVFLSAVVAILSSALALWVVGRSHVRTRALLVAGILMGFAIAGMHYIGMAAMVTTVDIYYKPLLVLASVLIAFGASFLALILALRHRHDSSRKVPMAKAISALMLGTAISGMHYTAMAAVGFTGGDGALSVPEERILATSGLAGVVVFSTFVILGLALFTAVVDRWRGTAVAEARALRASEERLRRFHDALTFGVLVEDGAGKVLHANRTTEELLNLPLEQLKGKRIVDFAGKLVNEDGVPLEPPNYPGELVRRSGEPVPGQVVGTRTAGEGVRWLLTGARPVTDSTTGQEVVVVSLVDITDRRRAQLALRAREEELRKTYQELERRVEERTVELKLANRDLEAFSYSLSHDLRAPLRGVAGFSRALLEDFGADLDLVARGYIERIMTGANRMNELINDMLQLASLSASGLNRSHVDISDVVRQIARELDQRHPTHRVNFRVEDGLTAHADKQLLTIALENLLENAWKFSKGKESPKVEFGGEHTDEGLVFYLRDNGAGFDMEYVGRIFEPFQRLHAPSEFPGTGIGLATVKRVIDKHGGKIWAHSEAGSGSTFRFTLGG